VAISCRRSPAMQNGLSGPAGQFARTEPIFPPLGLTQWFNGFCTTFVDFT
jgi:hypothetical protein